MYLFIYIYGGLPCGKDVVEDELEKIFGDSGEVTGGGLGDNCCNIDMEIKDDLRSFHIIDNIQLVCRRLNINTRIKLDLNGEEITMANE